jgi:hypothetical protein
MVPSRARAMRYTEEVELLLEEMCRVLAFLEWDGNRWKERALRAPQRVNDTGHPSTSPENKGPLEEGLRAYALRQASVRQRLFATFAKQWHGVPAFIEMADRRIAGGEEEGEGLNNIA